MHIFRLIPIKTLADAGPGAYDIFVNDDNTQGPWDGSMEHPFQHIQDAVDFAIDYDMIYVYDGTYYERITISKSVTLRGAYKTSVFLDGSDTGDVVTITADNVTFEHFTIRNGNNGVRVKGDYTEIRY